MNMTRIDYNQTDMRSSLLMEHEYGKARGKKSESGFCLAREPTSASKQNLGVIRGRPLTDGKVALHGQ